MLPGGRFTGHGVARACASSAAATTPGSTPTTRSRGETRIASIGNEKGVNVFEQRDVEVPRVLEPARHQRRRQQVLPAATWARPSATRPASAS